jgi:Holliday junction DNA helicase RuvA
MIAQVSGKLVQKTTGSVVIDVGGVGYEVFIPLSTYYKLPEPNETITLKTHTFVKEDSIQLYGFFSQHERELFQMLIGVAGVGPKLACNILSGMSSEALISSIAGGDLASLKAMPGVGKKTAERVIVELKDTVRTIAEFHPGTGIEQGLHDDVVSALNNIGYRTAQAKQALSRAKQELPEGAGFEELFKSALKKLSSVHTKQV